MNGSNPIAAPNLIQSSLIQGPRTIPQQIADACGMMIIDGHFAPGQHMVEQQIAEQFGVSRGPVREAFRILQGRHLLEIAPRKGAYVLPVSIDSVRDLFNVRIALACLAVRTVCENPPDEQTLFHLRDRVQRLEEMAENPDCDHVPFAFGVSRAVHALVRGSGNRLVLRMMQELSEQTIWTTIWKKPLDYDGVEVRRERAGQFRVVSRNVEARRGDAAEINLRLALESSRDRALEVLRAQAFGVA
ncbi:MAG: GntR family transcriptional regulator [Pseudochelatococcus sp.]|jgi:DNA-binding GntR family transcriptional regulator|uniref:GntR family transcriptional regulator n=1 Tax=Pseudochelatococcus sp. TaxID=2020869 RepID=UPI003D943A0F